MNVGSIRESVSPHNELVVVTANELARAFAEDVRSGLSASPKRINSKYLYDERGDALFRQITRTSEYYLTNCESEILEVSAEAILRSFGVDDPFDVVELGPGDGSKTDYFLEATVRLQPQARYIPVDIAESALRDLADHLCARHPTLRVEPRWGDYTQALQELRESPDRPELVLFLGSSIGNYTDDQAAQLLASLCAGMSPCDALLVGFDLRKHPSIIHDAYNDRLGLTREFNLNLLRRINRELGGRFALDGFDHFETYDPVAGVATSYLVSLQDQEVWIEALDSTYRFRRWELVHTEISRKYSLDEIEAIAKRAGLRVSRRFFDQRSFFVDVLMQPESPNPAAESMVPLPHERSAGGYPWAENF